MLPLDVCENADCVECAEKAELAERGESGDRLRGSGV